MAQRKKPRISDYSKRVEWCLKNLDVNSRYTRYLTRWQDIWDVMSAAHDRGDLKGECIAFSSFRKVHYSGEVPQPLIDWMCMLFPDLTEARLTAETYSQFEECFDSYMEDRHRWDAAIEFMAQDRIAINTVAKKFYESVDASASDFPLVLQEERWMRSEPVELTREYEQEFLAEIRDGHKFDAPKLRGLSGEYSSYKGTKVYRERKKVRKEPQHNGEIFCIDDVLFDDSGLCGLTYFFSNYFDYINTCEILGAELADWVLRNGEDAALPDRFEHRGTPEQIFDYRSRATYPGVNCISLFLNYDGTNYGTVGNYFPLHKRDETQTQAQNLVHVVPAGGHQGFSMGAQSADTAIRQTVTREFLEEFFNLEDLNTQPASWHDFRNHPQVKPLYELFFSDVNPAAKIYLFGMGIDPVTCKPEVLCGVVVDWSIYRRRGGKEEINPNWELRSAGTDTRRDVWVQLTKDNLIEQASGGKQRLENGMWLKTLPAGEVCMRYAADHLDMLIGSFGQGTR